MAEPVLELSNVTVRRGMGVVLRNFSLTVNAGECVVLYGENGVGKSTVIETAARLLPLEEGAVKHNGRLVYDAEGRSVNPVNPFGLTLQANCLVPSQTIQQQLDNVVAVCGKSCDFNSVLEQYNIGNRRNDKIAHLSGGQQRKVAVICGLIPGMVSHESRLILLDEPDSGLDDASVEVLIEQIHQLRNLGHGIVIASHDKRMRECATSLHNLSVVSQQEPKHSISWEVSATEKSYPLLRTKIGWNLNLTTLVSVQRNWLAALLVMGCLLSIADPLGLSENKMILMGFTLAPAFTMGLVGDPVFKILMEQRSVDWWRAQSNTIPNSYLESIISGIIFTAIAMQIFIQSTDYRVILIGGFVTLITSFIVRFLQMSTVRLPRNNAVFIRLLTPVLILPWGLVVDYCASL